MKWRNSRGQLKSQYEKKLRQVLSKIGFIAESPCAQRRKTPENSRVHDGNRPLPPGLDGVNPQANMSMCDDL
eukprot:186378-Amphidinium_carterae.1